MFLSWWFSITLHHKISWPPLCICLAYFVDNSPLFWMLLFSLFTAFAAALEVFPPLNDALELAAFTDEALKYKVCMYVHLLGV